MSLDKHMITKHQEQEQAEVQGQYEVTVMKGDPEEDNKNLSSVSRCWTSSFPRAEKKIGFVKTGGKGL